MTNPRTGVVEKLWGRAVPVHADDHAEVWYARVAPGGFSSLHHHAHKFNKFHVVAGELEVESEDPGDPGNVRIVRLAPGGAYTVPPRVRHRFRALTGVVMVEVYWPEGEAGPPRPEDIHRHDEGGCRVFAAEAATDA